MLDKLRKLYWKWQYQRNVKHTKNIIENQDIALGHVWYKHDYPKIRREYDLIRAGLIPADTIAKNIIRLWNDQRYGTRFHNKLNRFEPEQWCKYGDLVVKEGQLHFSRMHVGLTSGPPDYIAIGTGTATPNLADFQLTIQTVRNNLLINGGYRDLVGEDEYYGMLFLPSLGTNTYTEAGLFKGKDAASGDLMITHNKLLPSLAHTINDNAPGIEIIIRHRSYVV